MSRLGSLAGLPADPASEMAIEPPVSDFQALRMLVSEIHTKLNLDDPTPTVRVHASGDDWKLTPPNREVSPNADASAKASLKVPTLPRRPSPRLEESAKSGGLEKQLTEAMPMVQDKVHPRTVVQSQQQQFLQLPGQLPSPRELLNVRSQEQPLVATALRKLDSSFSSAHGGSCESDFVVRRSASGSDASGPARGHHAPVRAVSPARAGSPVMFGVPSQLSPRDLKPQPFDRSAPHLEHSTRHLMIGHHLATPVRAQSQALLSTRSKASTCQAIRRGR